MKKKKKMKAWSKHRQEGKGRYIHTRSLLIAAGVLAGSSFARLIKGDEMFFSLSNSMLLFIITYLASRMGTTYAWKKNEKKYNQFIASKKNDPGSLQECK